MFAAVCNVVLNGLLLSHQTQPVLVMPCYENTYATNSLQEVHFISLAHFTHLLCQHNLLNLLEGKEVNHGHHQ